MIRVTVELRSARGRQYDEVLGVAEIVNDGIESRLTHGTKGSYDVRITKRGKAASQTWKTGRVEGFMRRKYGAWDLLYLALKEIIGERNKTTEKKR